MAINALFDNMSGAYIAITSYYVVTLFRPRDRLDLTAIRTSET